MNAAARPPASTKEMARLRNSGSDVSAAAKRYCWAKATETPRSGAPAVRSQKRPPARAATLTRPPAAALRAPSTKPARRPTRFMSSEAGIVLRATSKRQADGRNTKLAHGKVLDDSDIPVGMRWGVGGAIAQKFAREGFFVVLTTRSAANASALEKAIIEQGGEGMIVELDLVSRESISRAFATIRKHVGDPDVLVYNAGYLEGRDLPPEKEMLEHVPIEIFETAQHIASRGPFLVAQEVLPAMRQRGAGSFLISNNPFSLRGRKRMTGQSLYYPRVMMRTLAQVLTEEYSEHGVHVANVVIDGLIDSPGTNALPKPQQNCDVVMNPVKMAEAFYYLHTQDKSCWTHELQLTPFATKPSF